MHCTSPSLNPHGGVCDYSVCDHIRYGGAFEWWQEQEGRSYPVCWLTTDGDVCDHLFRWKRLLAAKLIDELPTHCDDVSTNLPKEDYICQVMERIIQLFKKMVIEACKQDPFIQKHYRGGWVSDSFLALNHDGVNPMDSLRRAATRFADARYPRWSDRLLQSLMYLIV